MEQHEYDVVVVGKGNAALCAALAAQDQGVKVAMLEAASEDEHGGNSRFAGGVMRFAYATVEDLRRVTNVTEDEVATSDFGTNTREEFLDDLYRLTSYRTDPDLSELLVNRSLDTMDSNSLPRISAGSAGPVLTNRSTASLVARASEI